MLSRLDKEQETIKQSVETGTKALDTVWNFIKNLFLIFFFVKRKMIKFVFLIFLVESEFRVKHRFDQDKLWTSKRAYYQDWWQKLESLEIDNQLIKIAKHLLFLTLFIHIYSSYILLVIKYYLQQQQKSKPIRVILILSNLKLIN